MVSYLSSHFFCAFAKVLKANYYHVEIPQYAPGAAYRQLEFLLGRISNLSEIGPYTTLQ